MLKSYEIKPYIFNLRHNTFQNYYWKYVFYHSKRIDYNSIWSRDEWPSLKEFFKIYEVQISDRGQWPSATHRKGSITDVTLDNNINDLFTLPSVEVLGECQFDCILKCASCSSVWGVPHLSLRYFLVGFSWK